MERVLVVEDERHIARGLEQNLRFEGFQVLLAEDGERGLELAVDSVPDLILLDVMLPKMNGFEVLRSLRKLELTMPVILLTAKAEDIDKVRGLDLGADDYITKPFSVTELLARVRAIMRRKRAFERKIDKTCFGRASIDFAARTALVDGRPITMTTKEMELLRFLVGREGEAIGREEIVKRVWGYDYEGTDRTLDNFISRLRSKLERDPAHPEHLLTVRGVGYRFVGGQGG